MSMSERVTEFFEVLPPYIPPPTSCICKSSGIVVAGSCAGTDSVT